MKIQLLLLFCLGLLLSACQHQDTLFEKLSSSQTHITFNNALDESPDFNVLKYGYFYNGGGVAAADFNNDGRIDLYFTGNLSPNKLYLNKTEPGSGEISFEDITDKAGVAAADGWNTGVSVVDINADGWLDLYVCRSAAGETRLRRNLLFINNRNLTFTEKAADYGLDDPAFSTQAAFFDYDRDGDLDCFLLNHSVQEYAGFSRMLSQFKEQSNPNYASKLYRNDLSTGGKFVDVSAPSGLLSNVLSFGLALAVSDYNNDGWLDMYVSNDYNENDYLYINQQNGTFREEVRQAMGHTSLYSMGSDAADINNDNRIDLLTLDMLPESNERIKLTSGDDNYDKYTQLLQAGFHHQTMRNMLQLNVGTENGREWLGIAGNNPSLPANPAYPATPHPTVPIFSEIGQMAGVSNTDWSWAGLMADFDNDGWKDIFITNGYARDYTNMEFLKFTMDEQLQARQTGKQSDPMSVIAQMPSINEPNYIFKNTGNLTFENKTTDWGFAEPSQSNGAAYADLDNDGDLDLVINNVNAEASVYENHTETATQHQYLRVDFKAVHPAKVIGARVRVWAGGSMQVQECQPVRGFQSSIYGSLLFGLGQATQADSVDIRWADGKIQKLIPGATTQLTVRYQPTQDFVAPTQAHPYWEALSPLSVTHREDTLNDFKIQPLLPYMLSETGPHLAVGDCNGDGQADAFVGGGRGQGGRVLVQQNGQWVPLSEPALLADRDYEDACATWADVDLDNDLDLLVASAGYELPAGDARLQVRLYLNNGSGLLTRATNFPDCRLSASCIAVADMDRDGDQDVFVGARVVPGQYPAAPQSHVLLNDGKGHFTDVTARQSALKGLGMVTDAVWADLNQDKKPELLVATDFGSIRIYSNAQGALQELSSTLSGSTGCWNKLLIQDFDADGDLDIVAGNAGTNSQLWADTKHPLTLYGIESTARTLMPVLAGYEPHARSGAFLYPFNARDEMLDQMAPLRKKFPDYISYSKATLTDLFTPEELGRANKLEAGILQTVLFRNDTPKGAQEEQFTMVPLPNEAQVSPVYALASADVNQDGLPDLILGGNRAFNRVRIGKADANRGQLFLNQLKAGKQSFVYVPMPQSGLLWSGDVRDLVTLPVGHHTELFVGIVNQPVSVFRLANQPKQVTH